MTIVKIIWQQNQWNQISNYNPGHIILELYNILV